MATLTGTTIGLWAFASAQTGMLIESQSENSKCKDKEIPDYKGDPVGISQWAETVTISQAGYVPATSAFTGTLASAMSITNTIYDHIQGSISGGTYLIKDVTRNRAAEDFQKITIGSVYYPLIATT